MPGPSNNKKKAKGRAGKKRPSGTHLPEQEQKECGGDASCQVVDMAEVVERGDDERESRNNGHQNYDRHNYDQDSYKHDDRDYYDREDDWEDVHDERHEYELQMRGRPRYRRYYGHHQGNAPIESDISSSSSLKTPPPPPARTLQDIHHDPLTSSSHPSDANSLIPLPADAEWEPKPCPKLDASVPHAVEKVMFQPPFIHDPGNGPRVRDAKAFLGSFFAKEADLEDPLCAEFAQDEVLQMLCTVLPEETALILWYNKSRSQSRVCPACQRLYRLGDILADLIDEGEGNNGDEKPISPFLVREQHLSGLCSPMCFILASFNYPGAIRSAWGRMAEEMDDEAWGHLNGPGAGTVPSAGQTLGMLVRMTRLDDLGLGQLCFGE